MPVGNGRASRFAGLRVGRSLAFRPCRWCCYFIVVPKNQVLDLMIGIGRPLGHCTTKAFLGCPKPWADGVHEPIGKCSAADIYGGGHGGRSSH